MFTCQGSTAVKNRKKNLARFTKVLDGLEKVPTITKVIIGSLRHVHNDNTPSVYSFDNANFGGDISIKGFIEDQADIGWTNFLCGRWTVKWKEAQMREYLQMNKRKSAHLRIIAIFEKLHLI